MQTLFKSFLILLFMCSAAMADIPLQHRETVVRNPIKDVTPYVEHDKALIIAFIKFNCPACRMYHAPLAEWARTLPKGITFQFYPVIEAGDGHSVSLDSLFGLQAFWVAERLGGGINRALFAEEAYSLSQDEGAGGDKERWFSALTHQFKPKNIAAAWKSELKLSDERLKRQFHYNPTSTPTLVICGKWMISPEVTQGNRELFAQLANGLVSKCADELHLVVNRGQ